MNFIKYLNKPYPWTLNKWKAIISISIFISVFLIIFQPFGLQYVQLDHKTMILAGYGLVTFFLLVINMIVLPFLFISFFDESKWTILKQILWLSWIVISIGACNYIYSFLFSIFAWIGIQGFLIFTGFTFAIALIPVALVTILTHNRLLKNNLRRSHEINDLITNKKTNWERNDDITTITSESGNQKIETTVSDLICIESVGNYANTWYLKDDELKHELIRNTLKNIESQINNSEIMFKCHRAFIINLNYVEKVKGNSQGYQLIIQHLDSEIPVARNYTKTFKEVMNSLK